MKTKGRPTSKNLEVDENYKKKISKVNATKERTKNTANSNLLDKEQIKNWNTDDFTRLDQSLTNTNPKLVTNKSRKLKNIKEKYPSAKFQLPMK